MPFDMEKHGKLVQLLISSGNFLILLCGLLWAFAVFYGDTKSTDRTMRENVLAIQERVAKLEGSNAAMFGTVRDGQEKTNGRLTTLETQNVFILRSLDRLEAALAGNGVRQ